LFLWFRGGVLPRVKETS